MRETRSIAAFGKLYPVFRNSHSQTVRTRQPSFVSCCFTLLSRSLLPSSFCFQNCWLLPGHLKYLQSWQCQKQPCTKTTVWRDGNMRSGLPGRPPPPSRYRKPRECKVFRRKTSGLVSLPLMPAIIRLRVAVSTTSANDRRLQSLHEVRVRGFVDLVTMLFEQE